MLPEQEINVLMNTVLDAVELAAVREVEKGYARLHGGLQRVEEARASGMPWAGDLQRRYQEALCNYVSRYGVAQRRRAH